MKQPLKRERCTRKVAHKSKGAAEAHIRSLEKRGILDGELRPYVCSYGPHWHVAHVTKKERAA